MLKCRTCSVTSTDKITTTILFQLKAAFPGKCSGLEEFPGKHWFSSLSPDQLLARKVGLERYLHSICQERTIGTSDMLKEFLIAVQKVRGVGCAVQRVEGAG